MIWSILGTIALCYFGTVGVVGLLTMRDWHRDVTLMRRINEGAEMLFVAPFMIVALILYGAWVGLCRLVRFPLKWTRRNG